jgi:1,4-alpha-glucan branching enzyme
MAPMPYKVLKSGKVKFFWRNPSAHRVYLVGDFNRWDEHSHPMRKMADEKFELALDLPPGQYQFKYLADGIYWNDPDADDYVDNYWGSEDSVIRIGTN